MPLKACRFESGLRYQQPLYINVLGRLCPASELLFCFFVKNQQNTVRMYVFLVKMLFVGYSSLGFTRAHSAGNAYDGLLTAFKKETMRTSRRYLMLINKKLALAALLAPALAIGSVYAAEPGFYLGASGGQSFIDDEYGDQDYKIDDDETGWKAYLGYQFLPWLGVEAGYVDFGSYSSDQLFGIGDAELDLSAWEGFLVGTLPIGPVDLFAKVGAADLQYEVDTQNFGTDSDNDTQLAYGVGAAYNFGKGHWGLRAEAEGYDDDEVDNFYFVSAGITYRFFSDPVAPVAAAPVAAVPEKCPDSDGDGVCDDVDQCPNTAPGKRVGPVGCDCDFTLQLQFAFDSAKLTAGDIAQLDELVPILNNAKTGFMGGVIEGHTDSIGSAEYNMGLSKRRAESVASHMQSRGVNLGSRFATEAFGEAKPIASNETEAGRAENRRVVIRRTDCDSSSK
jgi:OmpA-OmpF porin, OOP family